MPIYEYRCRQCLRRFTLLVLKVRDSGPFKCKHCGSPDIEKLISRIRVIKSEEARLESLADPSKLSGVDENDPVSMAKWMKKMGKEMGGDMDGGEYEQMIDEAVHEAEREKRGETPEPEDSADL